MPLKGTGFAVQACIPIYGFSDFHFKNLCITVMYQETQTDRSPIRSHQTALIVLSSIFIADHQCITEKELAIT